MLNSAYPGDALVLISVTSIVTGSPELPKFSMTKIPPFDTLASKVDGLYEFPLPP